MKFNIVAPDGSEKIKEFSSYEAVNHYIKVKNNEIYRNDVQAEKLDFPLKVIE